VACLTAPLGFTATAQDLNEVEVNESIILRIKSQHCTDPSNEHLTNKKQFLLKHH